MDLGKDTGIYCQTKTWCLHFAGELVILEVVKVEYFDAIYKDSDMKDVKIYIWVGLRYFYVHDVCGSRSAGDKDRVLTIRTFSQISQLWSFS